jgi:pilus assembly protein Flp/PilA
MRPCAFLVEQEAWRLSCVNGKAGNFVNEPNAQVQALNFSEIFTLCLNELAKRPSYCPREPASNKQRRTNMRNLFTRFAQDSSGATTIEYGLIAAGITLAIIVVVLGLASKIHATFTSQALN